MDSMNKVSHNFFQLPGMKRSSTEDGAAEKEKKLPLIGRLPNKIRNHFVAMVGEFCGTFLFLFFAFSGTQIANAAAATQTSSSQNSASLPQLPDTGVLLYISLAFGFSLMVNVWVFFRISGGLFNPAVTLALALIGGITWIRAGLVFIAEILAGMAAAGVVAALFPGPMAVSTTLSTNTSVTRGLFIEMFLTAELVFTICMLAAEKHKGTFLAPVGIGIALFVAELGGVYFTGGSLNPARSFGPCVVLGKFPGYHWIYWLGPVLGSLLAVGFYRFVKMLEYETANPGQDFNEKEDEAFEFQEDRARSADVERPVPGMQAPAIPGGQLGKSLSMPVNANQDLDGKLYTDNDPRTNDDGRVYQTLDPRANQNFGGSGMHPGYGDAGDAAYQNSGRAERGDMRNGRNSRRTYEGA